MNYVYTIYHNQGLDRFHRAGTENDPYTLGYTAVIPAKDVEAVQGEDVVSALFEWVFTAHNRDDRPDRETAPSLSVGDIVALTTYEAAEAIRTDWRTVDMVGFKPVGIPVHASLTKES